VKKERDSILQVFAKQQSSRLHAAALRADNLPDGYGNLGNSQTLYHLRLTRLERGRHPYVQEQMAVQNEITQLEAAP
jgi:hypothetical protein